MKLIYKDDVYFYEVANLYKFVWPYSLFFFKPQWRVGLGAGLCEGYSYKGNS